MFGNELHAADKLGSMTHVEMRKELKKLFNRNPSWDEIHELRNYGVYLLLRDDIVKKK